MNEKYYIIRKRDNEMTFDNKTILIIGLVIGGLLSLYLNQQNLASAIFGGLIGYLSKDKIQLDQIIEDDSEDGSDS